MKRPSEGKGFGGSAGWEAPGARGAGELVVPGMPQVPRRLPVPAAPRLGSQRHPAGGTAAHPSRGCGARERCGCSVVLSCVCCETKLKRWQITGSSRIKGIVSWLSEESSRQVIYVYYILFRDRNFTLLYHWRLVSFRVASDFQCRFSRLNYFFFPLGL